MNFHDNSLVSGLLKYDDLDEAHKLDIDSGSPPLTVDELDKQCKRVSVEMRGVWQTVDNCLYYASEEIDDTRTEKRLVGFIIYTPYTTKPSQIHRFSVHYLANYLLVANALLNEVTGSVVTTVRQRNLTKKLASFLKSRGFYKVKTSDNYFSRPTDTGVFFKYDKSGNERVRHWAGDESYQKGELQV